MAELGRLAETLGLEVVGVLEQNRRDNSGYIGRGKRLELAGEVLESGAGMVITDDELTASQARVLERDCEAPVIDRTELIIRIFNEHARDAPSKLQVELAQMTYLLPRIRGMWRHLERLGGGSAGSAGSSGSSASGGRATRGPGEQQLEYDRRQIRTRMERLKKRLDEETASRAVRRSRLRSNEMPKVALVGYTNAGKTTILNALSDAGRQTKDRLFETLETTTRKVESIGVEHTGTTEINRENNSTGNSGGYRPEFTVTDTVGFIRKLPTQLVESFSSTLEAASDADVLVLCADISSKSLEEEIRVVRETIAQEDSKPIILMLNKLDLIESDIEKDDGFDVSDDTEHSGRSVGEVLDLVGGSFTEVVVSDHSRGYDELLDVIYEKISDMRGRLSVLIPHEDYSEVARLYGTATIHERIETEEGVFMDVSLPKEMVQSYGRYRSRKQHTAISSPSGDAR